VLQIRSDQAVRIVVVVARPVGAARRRHPYVESYSYYEDELAKVHGQWLFRKRVIVNEQRADAGSSGRWPLPD